MGALGKRGRWGKSRAQKQQNIGAISPHGPRRQRVDAVEGAAVTLAALQFSQKLRFQGPPQASGQDFPGFSAQVNRLGESLRATCLRLLHVLGTITRVCDSETLRMGQGVPPSSQGQGPLRLSSR